MSILDAVLLGILQGLTEFLPVSSSGHLVLLQDFLEISEPQLLFDVMVHVGTLGAICLVYRSDIWSIAKSCLLIFHRSDKRQSSDTKSGNPVWFVASDATPTVLTGSRKRSIFAHPERKFALFIVLGTVPAVLVGLFLGDFIESAFANPMLVACMLLVTGSLLQLSRIGHKKDRRDELSILDALRIGVAQATAIMPGISRSGTTISIALATGVNQKTAAKYSFLLSIPAIWGAAVLSLKDIHEIGLPPEILIVGMITSFIVGYFALKILLASLNSGRFSVFSYYCWALGVLVLIWKLL